MTKLLSALAKVLTRLGELMFHRLAVIAALIVMQMAFYWAAFSFMRSSPYFQPLNGAMALLSALVVLWIAGNRSNPGYKVGWIIIVMLLMPFGAVAYLFLGGNRLSRYNQRRLRAMERKVSRNLGPDCGRADTLARLAGEDAVGFFGETG